MIDLDELEPSSWVVRYSKLFKLSSSILDVPCGQGRHARLLLERGHKLVLVDRDLESVVDLSRRDDVETFQLDLEDGSPWILGKRKFAGIVVTNYVYRPLFPLLSAALEPGGVLIYDSFAIGHHKFPEKWLLRKNELIEAFGSMQIIAYEAGRVPGLGGAVKQRICIRNGEDIVDLF